MTITKRSDGSIALDWGPGLNRGGPFIVLTREQWQEFWREVRAMGIR